MTSVSSASTAPPTTAGALLDEVVAGQRAGRAAGVTSVCSAHPLVLEAALAQARDDGAVALVEATSNQSDQFGGYTGMTPAGFRDLVHAIAQEVGFDVSRLVLGGDHLGPQRWREKGAQAAMDLAEGLVEAYVAAGYTKIHLDCSMACAGDPPALDDAVVAQRAARLAAVAERTALGTGGREAQEALRYVIGTEVPVPGGADHELGVITPTAPDAARATVAAHREAFAAAGVADASERVMALVVQPGVEFDHLRVVDYDRPAARALSAVFDHPAAGGVAPLLFEAHSTDYQSREALRALVVDHWGVLKVGPALTFALRETLFALARVAGELELEGPGGRPLPCLPDVVDAVMVEDPQWWKSYYGGDEREQRIARRYSYSDRLRYYWPQPRIAAASSALLEALSATAIPEPLLSAHLPAQHARVRSGALANDPHDLVVDGVRDVLRDYAHACHPEETP